MTVSQLVDVNADNVPDKASTHYTSQCLAGARRIDTSLTAVKIVLESCEVLKYV